MKAIKNLFEWKTEDKTKVEIQNPEKKKVP